MHNGENVGDDAGGPDQPTEGEEGVAQVESLPHCETNLAIVGNQVKDEYELSYFRSHHCGFYCGSSVKDHTENIRYKEEQI